METICSIRVSCYLINSIGPRDVMNYVQGNNLKNNNYKYDENLNVGLNFQGFTYYMRKCLPTVWLNEICLCANVNYESNNESTENSNGTVHALTREDIFKQISVIYIITKNLFNEF